MESGSARPAIDMQSDGDGPYRMQAGAREPPHTRSRKQKLRGRASTYDKVIKVEGGKMKI